MKVRVHARGGTAALIGGLLAAAGHDVVFLRRSPAGGRGSARRLRLVLPDRWLQVTVGQRPAGTRGGDLALVSPGGEAGGARMALTLLPGTLGAGRERGPAGGDAPPAALGLMSVVQLEENEVQLASQYSRLMLSGGGPHAGALSEALGREGVEVTAVEEIAGYESSWALRRLLLLPAALCRSGVEHFLSHPEGRGIALRVLEEGIQTHHRLGRPLARLPVQDPVELAERIRREGESFNAACWLPEPGSNELLQAAQRGEKPDVRGLNERLVRLAAQAGVEARCNWALARKVSRLQQGVFYSGPAELYESLG